MEKFNILNAIKEEALKDKVNKMPLKPEEFKRKKEIHIKQAKQLIEERKKRVEQKIELARYKKVL